ncbi:MAG: hypothetical protein IJ668_04510 [Selenomonadaceae bacterium]|nr:hypothetical protein [Selenomonadaceae bacterium]
MDEIILKQLIEGGAVTILGGLCFYLVVHFNKAINKTNEVIAGNTDAIKKLAEATNRQLVQLERIEGYVKRTEEKIDRLKEDFIKMKAN